MQRTDELGRRGVVLVHRYLALTKIVGGTCSSGTTQFAEGIINDPGTNSTWLCKVKNQNAVTAGISAQGTAICIGQ